MPLTPDEYNVLEQAVSRGRRIALERRGTELVLVPLRLLVRADGEAIEARHPSTGDVLMVKVSEISSIVLL